MSQRPEILPVEAETEILFQRACDQVEIGLRAFKGAITTSDDMSRAIAGQAVAGVLNALRFMSGRQMAVLLAREASHGVGYVIHEPPQYSEDEIGNVR